MKIEIADIPSEKIEFWWHDNDTFEFASIPASLPSSQISDGISMMRVVINFMRNYGKSSFKVEK